MSSRALKRRHGVRKKDKKSVGLSIFLICVVAIVAAMFGLLALCQSWLEDLPDYTKADAYNSAATSTVYASDGQTVLAEFQIENRTPVQADEISQYVLDGTVATEDERFYTHSGVDWPGVVRALFNDLLGGNLEGGSTITQQFVRNTILSDEMSDISVKRKIREMYIAMKLEEQFSKDDILLMYLNTINYGSGAYGIEAASERYFSKHASELTLDEAAALVGIPQSPSYNNPIENFDNCLERRNLVLDRMASNGYITEDEAEEAKAKELVLNPSEPADTGILAYDYFTSYVRNQLLSSEGYSFSTSEIFEGGWNIYTTLDVDVQNDAEIAAANKVAEEGSSYEVSLVAIDPNNGYIRALVGGKDYDSDQVNMATGEGGSGRQSGSSFKTFTLLTAIEQGINPNTLIDAGSTVEVEGSTSVSNSGGRSYGTRSIASAFAVSSNTAFVRLAMSVGIDNVIDMAHRCGITSDLSDVVGVTLGIDSVTPLEMADAYATIANGGIHYKPECIERIVDRNGELIVDNSSPTGERVISEEVAHAAIEVMEGVITSGTGTAAALNCGQEAAGKTGTTESSMDSWFCGITPQYSVAIWLGDRRGYTEGRAVSGSAASVFSDFLDRVLADAPHEYFPDAASPPYQDDYTDAENHIGGYYSSSGSGSSNSYRYYDDDDDDDYSYSGNSGNSGYRNSSRNSYYGNNYYDDDDDYSYSGNSSTNSGGNSSYSGGGGDSSYSGGGDDSSYSGGGDTSSGGGGESYDSGGESSSGESPGSEGGGGADEGGGGGSEGGGEESSE